MGMAGLQDAALMFGGEPIQNTSEEYNGTSWSAGNTLITAVVGNSGVGTQNAALSIGGYNPGTTAVVESYDGANWTAGTPIITARKYSVSFGTQNSALNTNGDAPAGKVSCTEFFDGVAWSSHASSPVILTNTQSSTKSPSSSGIIFGGNNPATQSTTAEYNCTSKQQLGAGTQNWIGKVNFVTG